VATVGHEFERGRLEHGLTYRAVGQVVDLSPSEVGRIAHGAVPGLTIVQASRLLAAVGLELSVRAYPTGRAVRDRAHLALLEALRQAIHPSLRWATEVPIELPGDLRAWDATIHGATWWSGVEAETRLHDLQALDRRLALKQRDSAAPSVLLLLADTRHNRTVLRSEPASLARFPLSSVRALELLRAGVDPGGNAVLLLPAVPRLPARRSPRRS
jgi:hypothetical protein